MELKTTKIEFYIYKKKSLEGINNRFELAEGRFSKLADIPVKSIQSKRQKEE